MANYDSNNAIVKQIQHAINVAGYSNPLTEDGVYGPKTKAGVIWFQGQRGLTQDGIIGDATVAASGPTPPGSDPLAGMRAAVAALKATQAGVASGALPATIASSAPTPAAYDYLAGVNFAAASQAAHAPPPPQKTIKLSLPAAPVSAAIPAAIVPAPVAPRAVSPIVPMGVGAALGGALGAALGSVFTLPLLVAAGAGAALGAGVGYAARAWVPLSGMHGESDFGIDFGCDDSELTVIAGEIGMPTRVKSLGY